MSASQFLQQAADRHVFPHYYEIKRVRLGNSNSHNSKEGMEGFPLALVAENTPKLELLVEGNLKCRLIILLFKPELEPVSLLTRIPPNVQINV